MGAGSWRLTATLSGLVVWLVATPIAAWVGFDGLARLAFAAIVAGVLLATAAAVLVPKPRVREPDAAAGIVGSSDEPC